MPKNAPQRAALVRAFERRFGKAAGYSFSRSGTLYGVQDTATGSRLTGRFSASGRLTVVSAYGYAPEPEVALAPAPSDPVQADVACYLAVSTDAAGAETVMGVFRVAEHASAVDAEREAGKLCDRIRGAVPGAACVSRYSGPMVPQPCQPQQGRAKGPARGERRYVTVRDTETGETHRVLTSVARVGFAVVVFIPSNRHRQGALGGMLITHDDIRKAWVFNDAEEGRHMLSRNRAPGERVIPAELVSDPAA